MSPLDAPGHVAFLGEAGGTMRLVIDEAVAIELPLLLPVILKAWPGWSALVTSASLSECISALDRRDADAAIVRLQGIDCAEIGKFAALPLATTLTGTVILYRADGQPKLFERLAERAQASLPPIADVI
jgi:hypothetical protein